MSSLDLVKTERQTKIVEKAFDFIIAGGGMAGLSLAFYLNQSTLRDKKILLIDREIKNQNDHTWCFWEKEKNPFEEIILENGTGFGFTERKVFRSF